MTQKQFDACVKNKIPIYKIWVKGKFHKKKVTYEHVERCVEWINKEVPYSIEMHCDFMYTSGDRLDESTDKLFKYLEDCEEEKIKKAKKNLKYLKQARDDMGINSHADDSFDDEFIDELINC